MTCPAERLSRHRQHARRRRRGVAAPFLVLPFLVMLALVAGATVTAGGAARAADVAGSSDHPLVGRYEGATITFHEARAYDELRLPDRPRPRGNDVADEAWTRALTGRVTSIRYEGPGGRTALEILRNHQQALEAAGFATVLSCRGEDCAASAISRFWDAARAGIGLPSTWNTIVYLLAERDGAEGRVHVAIAGVETRARGDTPLTAHLAVTVVEGAPIETGRIAAPRVVEAGEFEAAFAADGRIAVYGITFDFDSDVLRAEAEPQIAELASVLARVPDLRVVIVGHTDSIGGFDYNVGLSQRRAQAVVEALASRHGIDRGRLVAAGAGMTAPVATNRTEEGRALNRRVEIVEIVAR